MRKAYDYEARLGGAFQVFVDWMCKTGFTPDQIYALVEKMEAALEQGNTFSLEVVVSEKDDDGSTTIKSGLRESCSTGFGSTANTRVAVMALSNAA